MHSFQHHLKAANRANSSSLAAPPKGKYSHSYRSSNRFGFDIELIKGSIREQTKVGAHIMSVLFETPLFILGNPNTERVRGYRLAWSDRSCQVVEERKVLKGTKAGYERERRPSLACN